MLVEKRSKFVRFPAVQSIYVFGALTIASIILSWMPFIGFVLGWLISVLGLILWTLLMVKAYQGTMYKLPWSDSLAEKQVG
jgi:uncharacterized membrane protein